MDLRYLHVTIIFLVFIFNQGNSMQKEKINANWWLSEEQEEKAEASELLEKVFSECSEYRNITQVFRDTIKKDKAQQDLEIRKRDERPKEGFYRYR